MNGMQSLKSLFDRAPKASSFMRQVNTAMALEAVNNYLTEKWGLTMLDKARAIHIRNGVLTIACLSSVAAQEIRMNEQAVIRAANGKDPSILVEKVKYLS